jgi:WD40 repeat protein
MVSASSLAHLTETVIIWRLRDGFSRVLTASDFYPRSVRLSLDGRYIASGDYYGNILIWNVRTGNLVARWRGHSNLVASLVFTPDGKSLLSGSWDNQVIQWDVSFLSSLGMANPPISDMMEISRLIGHTVC